MALRVSLSSLLIQIFGDFVAKIVCGSISRYHLFKEKKWGIRYFFSWRTAVNHGPPNSTSDHAIRFYRGLGSNNFSGSLLHELGNLVKLEQLYINSSGVSVEIPSTFANLQNLEIWRASNNQFTGKIPHFIGKLTKLTSLWLWGNSFEGPIPSSLSNLTSMQDLRISEVSNGGSSLAFIKDMKDLSILILRNNMISGIIPSNIGEYQALMQLDLSFNNLSGEIPASLFTLSSLTYFLETTGYLIHCLLRKVQHSLICMYDPAGGPWCSYYCPPTDGRWASPCMSRR
ncbi:probable LRR receptor-like serine/threonine-protein kinase At1g56140 [Magnolia sinica]|uniref:probable LRR receptor-like serine/threonine-protein kinase At1g56140 n=1 Tax=Magnolia sinica TaxID=86752 RepID=UPI00265AA369|nr:probable LRR receptor-like serine/threonine-protein kinase At1g56140 [Magnolia sinica]